jgi:pimeloyl-ACP methyl ester carboxylesterase
MKRFRYAMIFLYTLLLLVVLAFELGAPYLIIKPFKLGQRTTAAAQSLNYKALNIVTDDRINLVGDLVLPMTGKVRGALIMLHGINGNRSFFLRSAAQQAANGIAVFVFDQRGHGESGGEFCTFGYNEKKDISTILDTLQHYIPNIPIGVWGQSLGGAVAIQALEYDKRLKFGIVESTFARLSDIVYDYMELRLGFKARFLSDHALRKAEGIAHFDANKVQPIVSIAHVSQPLFMAHGDADQRISVEYGKALYASAVSVEKEFHLVHGAGHTNLSNVGGLEYNTAILDFLNRQFLNN